MNPEHHLEKILLPRDIVNHWEGGHFYGNRPPWRQDKGVQPRMFRRQGLQGYTRWEWGSSGCISAPPPHPDLCLSYKGGVLYKELLNSAACLLRPSLLIRAEARADPSAELPDGPLPPLPTRSYPIVHGYPSLIINPSPPHML